MILDTSAIIAFLAEEPEAEAITIALQNAAPGPFLIAAPTYFETYMVVYHRMGEKGLAELDRFGRELGIIIEAFHPHLAVIACDAYKRFHRGKNGLNFGDCFSYALAKARNEALLCKGNDFKHTDILLVEY